MRITLSDFSLPEIVMGQAIDARSDLYYTEKELGLTECVEAPLMITTREHLGEEITINLVVYVIWAFQRGLKLPLDRVMDMMDLVTCASAYMDTYSHDSVVDLIFALKTARRKGKVFYNKFTEQDLNQILMEHFEEKAVATVDANRRKGDYGKKEVAAKTLKLMEDTFSNAGEDKLNEPLSVKLAREKAREQTAKHTGVIKEADWLVPMCEREEILRGDGMEGLAS